jgi:hypothetical protein
LAAICCIAKEFSQLNPLTDKRLSIVVCDSNSADISNVFRNERWVFLKLMFGAESLISKVVYQKEFRDSQIRNSF